MAHYLVVRRINDFYAAVKQNPNDSFSGMQAAVTTALVIRFIVNVALTLA